MNARTLKRTMFGLLLLTAFAASACGTLELEVEHGPASGAVTHTPPATLAATEEATATPDSKEITPTPTTAPTPTEPSTGQEEGEMTSPPEITTLDDTWLRYTNDELGFAINFPKTMVHFFGACKWNEQNGDSSYRPEPAYVPVKIFEDGNTVYITSEYYHALAGEIKETSADGGTRSFFSECQVVTNDLALLQDPENHSQQKWQIVVETVRDDGELDAFIKSRYGAGCGLGEKTPSGQAGVYDVQIRGDGKDMSETQCLLNFGTVVKYYAEGNKVAAWDLGQAYTFPANPDYSAAYDQEMVDSFEFIADTQDPSSFMPTGASEEIADWWGIIGSTEPGAQFDDYFERQDLGQVIYFGIESRDPAVQAQIEALRDSGKVVHLYGTVLSNVPDYNGSQILVTRIEVEGEGTEADAPEGWETFVDDEFGFTFQYPADWALEVIPRRTLDKGAGSPQWLADAVLLTKDKLAISIQHMHTSESVAWDGSYGGGPYQEAITGDPLTLIGQDTHKMIWRYDDEIKALEVQAVNQEADLALTITLRDGSVLWVGDPAAETLPETAMGVLDGVLNSLALTQ